MDPQILNEGGGEKVAILALDEAGRVSIRGNAFFKTLLHNFTSASVSIC